MKENAINQNAYQYLLSLISPQVKVVDLQVRNKYLWAALDSGVNFAVKNQDID